MLPYVAILYLVPASVPNLCEASSTTMPGRYTSCDINYWYTTEGTFPRDGSSNYPGCCSDGGDSCLGNACNSETQDDDSGTPYRCVCV